MNESVILLGLLFISCPVTLFIGLVGGIVIYRTLFGKERGNHQRMRTVFLQRIPSGEIYHTVKRWVEDGWAYQIFDSKTVGEHEIILSKYL